ncbi:unnamed protein product [Hyaloperonospora brassicae]|uniref:RxLR effector candidate protein n=1 Tax=Hyaloperonospora brassicae TaxID=162125 RepID=A0AAV0T7R4_HYABA|nr:unnamed protein product [Hyaloperonospora brassicae]
MHFRVVLVLVVATIVTSCIRPTSANLSASEGRHDERTEAHYLRGEDALSAEDSLLESSPFDNKPKRSPSEEAPSAKAADQVELTLVRQKKLEALSKISEERGGISLGQFMLWGSLIGLTGGGAMLTYQHLKNPSHPHEAAFPGNMTGAV